MKIAILSYWCLDSSIPLAKHLADMNNEVDFYTLMPVDATGFVIDYSNIDPKQGFIEEKDQNSVINEKLKLYLKRINLITYLFNRFGRRNIYIGIWESYKLAHYLNKNKYDVIHIIGHDLPLLFLHKFIKNKNIVHTLHEVTNHSNHSAFRPIFFRYNLLNYLVKHREIKLIFNSEISKIRFLDYERKLIGKNTHRKIKTIYFGLYETYLCTHPKTIKITKNSEDFVVLFFGRILPYKGVEFLISAFKLIKSQYPHLQLIIAGDGKPYFDLENNPENFTFINKHLTDEEIVELNTLSDVVVCPYISASQSGIVMTSFLFGKPIIASRVGAFEEVIDHLKTGLLVEPSSAAELANAIETLLTNKTLYHEIVKNINLKFNDPSSDFSWQRISSQTESFYKE